jgi:hypothetical protein
MMVTLRLTATDNARRTAAVLSHTLRYPTTGTFDFRAEGMRPLFIMDIHARKPKRLWVWKPRSFRKSANVDAGRPIPCPVDDDSEFVARWGPAKHEPTAGLCR